MSPTKTSAEYAGAIAEQVAWQWQMTPDSCALNRRNGDISFEIDNWLRLALNCAKMTSLQLRYFKQPLVAQEYLKKSRWAVQQSEASFNYYDARNEIGTYPVSSFNFPSGMLCAWLYGDWRLAESFARFTAHPALKNRSRHAHIPGDSFAQLYALAALDNADDFEMRYAQFEAQIAAEKRHTKLWKKYHVHPALVGAILRRDEAGLNGLLVHCDALYYERGKDKAYDGQETIDGPYDFNPLMIEYRATALALLAIYRGMKVTFDSKVIPINVFKAWQASWVR